MKIGQFVTYQTGLGCYGRGQIVSIDEATDWIVIIDCDDGSRWTGAMDHAEICVDGSTQSEVISAEWPIVC